MTLSHYFDKDRRGITITVMLLGGVLLSVIFAYLVFGDNNDEEALRTIQMAAIVFRHGDRNPAKLYPNDPYKNHKWPGGLGALTTAGSLQMYQLGRNLQKRYYRLLPHNGLYSQETISVLSSYTERTQMSAQSFFAGFMPPLEHNNPLPIPWQPVAITSLPRDRDHLIAQKAPCPRYDEMLAKLLVTPPKDVREMNERNLQLYRMLTRYTGQNMSTILDIEWLHNTFEIERAAGLTLPEWVEGVFPDKTAPIAERSLALFTETTFMKKVKGGALLTEVLDKMLHKRAGLLAPDRTLYFYSGHDVTLVNLMNAMGLMDQTSRKPDYAAAFVFELHHSYLYDNDREVKLFYYFNSEDKFPKELSIPGCESPCSLSSFEKTYRTLIVRNYEEACEAFN